MFSSGKKEKSHTWGLIDRQIHTHEPFTFVISSKVWHKIDL